MSLSKCGFILLASLSLVSALPNGSPVCTANGPAPGSGHLAGDFVQGSLPDSDISISIDGVSISPDSAITLEVGVLYDVEIRTSTSFQGVMARLAGGDNDVDTSAVLSIPADEPNLQLLNVCPEDVGGVTHNNSVPKTVVTFSMEFTEPSSGMALDINVVETRTPSVFFYSQYVLDVVQLPELSTIYEIASTNNLIVAQLAEAVGLDTALNDTTQVYTVFAPVNTAFESLPEAVVIYLTENTEILNFVLQGHVLDQVDLSSADLVELDGNSLTFLNGEEEDVQVADLNLFIGFAEVVQADIPASNGVVHLIDSVLGVPSFAEILSDPNFSTLTTLGELSGIDLDNLFDVALFAPNDSAFSVFAAEYPDFVDAVQNSAAWRLHLQRLLLAHVTETTLFSSSITDGDQITMFSGAEVFTVAIRDTATLGPAVGPAGVATIVGVDAFSSQGVVHEIDQVLLPSFLQVSVFDAAQAALPTLASLVELAGLAETLSTAFGVTVFAPSEEAFAALDGEIVTYLTTTGANTTLVDILLYHVVPTVIPAESIEGTEAATTILGPNLTLTMSDMSVVVDGAANVTLPNILVNNGIIHLIDAVLLPPIDLPSVITGVNTTEVPTSTPTTAPNTTVPTMSPNTTSPTMVPNTTAPTSSPTLNSTLMPTMLLDQNETYVPTMAPSNGTMDVNATTMTPTTSPTASPSAEPDSTDMPTSAPTGTPDSTRDLSGSSLTFSAAWTCVVVAWGAWILL